MYKSQTSIKNAILLKMIENIQCIYSFPLTFYDWFKDKLCIFVKKKKNNGWTKIRRKRQMFRTIFMMNNPMSVA